MLIGILGWRLNNKNPNSSLWWCYIFFNNIIFLWSSTRGTCISILRLLLIVPSVNVVFNTITMNRPFIISLPLFNDLWNKLRLSHPWELVSVFIVLWARKVFVHKCQIIFVNFFEWLNSHWIEAFDHRKFQSEFLLLIYFFYFPSWMCALWGWHIFYDNLMFPYTKLRLYVIIVIIIVSILNIPL